MRVLVTGGTGFIGRHVAGLLAARGDDVVALVRPTADPWKTDLLRASGVTLAAGDVTEPASLSDAMRGADAVVHCAAMVRLGKVDEAAIHHVNVVGTENVLAAALEHDVHRVLHTSSIAALGVADGGDADESTEHSGRYSSPYERSKHLASRAAARYAQKGLHVVQALPSVVFGRRDPNFGVFFRAYMRRRIPVLPAPRTVLSLVHVEDLARGIVLALDRGHRGDRFIFTQANITLRDLMARIEAATGVPGPRIVVPAGLARVAVRAAAALAALTPWRGTLRPTSGRILGRRRSFSNHRARTALGWDPGDFDARLADTARYYALRYGPASVRPRLVDLVPDPPAPREASA